MIGRGIVIPLRRRMRFAAAAGHGLDGALWSGPRGRSSGDDDIEVLGLVEGSSCCQLATTALGA
jgi:hypothetical protein